MSETVANHLSIKATRFFMQIIGMWQVKKRRDEILSNFLLTSIVTSIIVGLTVVSIESFKSRDDLVVISYLIPCIVSALQELSKVAVFVYNRQKVKDFNTFTENKFFNIKYSRVDLEILEDCNRTCLWAYGVSTVLMQTIACFYISIPIVENLNKNQTDRELPFRIALDLPLSETPWFEICFVVEAMATCSVGICITTFAVFLFTINLYAAGQFKILRRKLKISSEIYPRDLENKSTNFLKQTENIAYENLKDCIVQHQLLIRYIETVENVYCYIILGQALGGVLQICFSSFQIVLGAQVSRQRTCLSIVYFVGHTIELFLFCWSCHTITEQSLAVAEAAYESSWHNMPCFENGKNYRRAILIMICRARNPCILTVGKFTPMSLNTFSSVLNTSLSYFMVLRQMRNDQ